MPKQDILDARVGDDFAVQGSVAQWNLHAAAARRGVVGPGVMGTSAGFQSREPVVPDPHLAIMVRNSTDADLGAYSILGIGEPIIPPEPVGGPADATLPLNALNSVMFDGIGPIVGKFAILLYDLPQGGMGEATITGDSWVRVHAVNEGAISKGFADADTSDATRLLFVDSGVCQVLWVDTPASYPSDVWAFVRFGGGGSDTSVRCNALLVNAITAGGMGPWDVDHVTMICGSNPLSDPSNSSEVVQVYNPVGFNGDAGGFCKFERCKDANRYEFYIIACPAGS